MVSILSLALTLSLVPWFLFLFSASPVLGDITFTLNEIIKCLVRPPLNTPTLGQTVYDEIGALFAGALLREMELDYAPVVRDMIWQEMLMAKPLNVITWPFIARCLLLVMRQCFQHNEALFVFHSPATEEDAMMQVSYPPRSNPIILTPTTNFATHSTTMTT